MPPGQKTPAQNRKIWALSSQLALKEDNLRDLVESVTGQRRVSLLTQPQALEVIRLLQAELAKRRKNKKRIGAPSSRVNKGQLRYLLDLADAIGWSEWDLRAWLKRYFRVSHEKWLTNVKATKAITALKDIRARNSGE